MAKIWFKKWQNNGPKLTGTPCRLVSNAFLRPCMWSKQKRFNVQDGLRGIEELKKSKSSLPIKMSALSSFCSVGKYPAPLSEVTSTAAIMCLVTTSQGDLRSLCVTKLKRLRQSSDRQISDSVSRQDTWLNYFQSQQKLGNWTESVSTRQKS